MADLSNGTTIGGFRQLHENLQKPTLFDKLVIEKHAPDGVWKYGDIGDDNVSLELGLRDGSGSGSIRLNSYDPNNFCFIRPSDGNLHIDSINGKYYFNWDPSSNGGNNGSIYLGTASGANGVALNAVGTSYFYGGGLNVSGNTSITGTLSVSSTITGSLSGNASTQTKLERQRKIILAGDIVGSQSFDGSQDAVISQIVQNDSHRHDTRYYTKTEVDNKDNSLASIINSLSSNLSNNYESKPIKGSNANGEYIRYENGLQITFQEIEHLAVPINNVYGNVYLSRPFFLTNLPANFEKIWRIMPFAEIDENQVTWITLDKNSYGSQVAYYFVNGRSIPAFDRKAQFLTIGRWK